ncbi:MAG: hypothetical protein ACQEP4_05185 [Bacillota bacterium]
MKTTKIVLLLIVLTIFMSGCSVGEIPLSEVDKTVIENYIRDEYRTGGVAGNTFVAIDILGSDKSKEEVYIWALIEEYSFGGTDANLESGASLPFVLEVDIDNDVMEITKSRIPGDGSIFTENVRELFPKELHSKILDYSSDHIEDLMDEMATKVEKRLLVSPEYRLAVEKAIEYVMESPWENRLRIDFSKVNIEGAPAELSDSLWTYDGPEVSNSISRGDILVELGSRADHDFAGLIFDIEKGEIIGYLPIQ